MPNYDVACSHCGYESEVQIKLADLEKWDLQASCPECQSSAKIFARVFRQAAAIRGGTKGSERSALAQKADSKQRFVKSGEKDAMLHKQAKTVDRQQIAEAREIVKSGKYEGF